MGSLHPRHKKGTGQNAVHAQYDLMKRGKPPAINYKLCDSGDNS